MLEGWTFGRKLGSGFAIAGLALVVLGALAHRSATQLIADQKWVNHTHQVRREMASLLARLLDAEAAARGFIITARNPMLVHVERAVEGAEKTFAELRTLTADNRDQQRRLDRLRPVVEQEIALIRRIVEQRRGGFEAAAATVSSGESERALGTIRVRIGELDAEESRLLDVRMEDASASASVTQAVSRWGSAGAVLVVALLGWLITRSLSVRIGTAVQHVQSSSSELQAASSEQASGAREQSTAMSEISTTISELLATSRQIAESARQVGLIARETATSARTGGEAVGRGNESMAAIRRQVDLIVTNMLALGKKSQDVGGVLDIVYELAEQTNILAINATIEAAGAGEAGRRFAVVADEIRKLADRVAISTKEIREMVEDVRGAVSSTIMTTEGGSKVVDAGARQFGEVAAAFQAIADRVATTTDAAREIELSTKQQSSAVEQVNTAVMSVAQQTRQTETSTTQTQQTASQLAGLSLDLLRIVQSQARRQARNGASRQAD